MKIYMTGFVALAAIWTAQVAQAAPDKATDVSGTAPYVTLDADLTEFKRDFNGMSHKIRLVFISGPSCGICLRGMDDLNTALVASLQNDSRIQTLVLYVPTLGAKEQHVAAAVPLMQGPRVSHYWDPEGNSGIQFQESLDIPMYAWDVWLMYEPGVRWEPDAVPPAPAFWQHQLPGLSKDQVLDADEFAAAVTAKLGDLPSGSVTDGAADLQPSVPNLLPVAQPRGVRIRQNHESRGGYDKLKTITTIRYENETDTGGHTYSLVLETARPAHYRRTVGDGEHRSTIQWDGAQLVRTGALRDLPPEFQEQLLVSYEFDGWMTDWKEKGHSVRRLGMKKYRDRLPWLMEAVLANGRTWHLYVDSHTGDAFRQVLIGANGEETIAVEFSDYRDADGFRLPRRIDYYEDDRLLASDRLRNIIVEVDTASASVVPSPNP